MYHIYFSNRFPLNKQGRELQQKGWDELAAKLNARNGCTISAEYWRKSWDDLRYVFYLYIL